MILKSELEKTIYYLRETRKALLGRGADISPTAGLKDVPGWIWAIPADASIAFQEDSSIAYEKIVPSGVEEYALVKSIGGMCYKSHNLCIADGYYNLDDIPKTHDNYVPLDLGVLDAGVYHLKVYGSYWRVYGITSCEGCAIDGFDQGYQSNNHDFAFIVSEKTQVQINLGSDYAYDYPHIDEHEPDSIESSCFSGEITGIMLVKISDGVPEDTWSYLQSLVLDTSLAYEPYIEGGIVYAKPTSLESRGANLFDVNGVLDTKKAGNIYISDGKIKDDNTSSSGTNFIWYSQTYPAGTYTLGAKVNNSSAESYYHKNYVRILLSVKTKGSSASLNSHYGGYVYSITHGKTISFIAEEPFKIGFTTIADTIGLDVEYYDIMLNPGAEAIPYKPYSAEPIDTFTLPENIEQGIKQAYEDKGVQIDCGWGLGIKAEYNNHIEIRNGRVFYVQKAYKDIIDGVNIKCGYVNKGASGNYFGQFKLSKTSVNGINLISSRFDATIANAQVGHIRITNNNILAYNYDQTITTKEDWNEWLLSNPFEVVYPLAEPIETDITHLFTDTSPFIKVQGSGSIIANNERKEAVPSTIKYTVKVGT